MSPAAEGTRKDLVAPHKRGSRGRGPRPFEKLAIYGYRAGAWLMGHLPVPVARGLVSFTLQASFVLWPQKRRYVNDNFAHVLGPPGDEPRGPAQGPGRVPLVCALRRRADAPAAAVE